MNIELWRTIMTIVTCAFILVCVVLFVLIVMGAEHPVHMERLVFYVLGCGMSLIGALASASAVNRLSWRIVNARRSESPLQQR